MIEQRYVIKLYDQEIAAFDFVQDGPGAAYPCHLEINPSTQHLLPMNVAAEPTDDELGRFLDTRRIPIGRAYVDELLGAYGITVSDTKGIIDITKGVSINDSYMVVPEGDPTTFASCNLYENDFDAALQIAAFTGVVPEGAFGTGLPSELTASGSFPKAWRIIDGKRVLYKASGIGPLVERNIEPYSELLASQAAHAMGLDAVEYRLAEWHGRVCSTCELFNTADISFVSLYSALPRRALAQFGLNRALELYFGMGPSESGKLLSMLVFDSIVANKDRHYGNFGLLRDNGTGKAIGMAPLFDHNLSLFCDERDSDLEVEKLLSARRRYSGAFATNLEDQIDYSIEEPQLAQVERLAEFEFEIPPEFLERPGRECDTFTKKRLEALNRYIRYIVKDIRESSSIL